MKYVLILSLLYKKYKENNGKLFLHLNDRLIDNISLSEDIDLKSVSYKCNIADRTQSWNGQVPGKCYYYEIESNEIDQNDVNKLHIRVENDYNNYTNGFMTKTSYVAFSSICLIPKHFFNIETIARFENRFRQKFWNKIMPRDYQKIQDKVSFDKWNKFITAASNKRGRWPMINWPLCYKTTKNQSKEAKCLEHIGGSFSIELPVVKKHRIYMIRQKEFYGPPFTVGESALHNLIGAIQINNKKDPWINITVNEDQRSNRTKD